MAAIIAAMNPLWQLSCIHFVLDGLSEEGVSTLQEGNKGKGLEAEMATASNDHDTTPVCKPFLCVAWATLPLYLLAVGTISWFKLCWK
jgi:hypothetical protein